MTQKSSGPLRPVLQIRIWAVPNDDLGQMQAYLLYITYFWQKFSSIKNTPALLSIVTLLILAACGKKRHENVTPNDTQGEKGKR